MSESPQASSSIDATAVDDGCDSASNASTCSDGDMGGGGTDGIANEKWNIWSREASALSLSAADSKLSLDQKMRVACPELFADVAVDPGQIGQVDKANRDAFHRAQTLRSSVRKVVAGRSMYGSLNSGISVLSLDPAAAARAGDAHPEEADKGVLRVFLRWMSPLIEVARRGQVLAGDLWACPRSADVKRSAKRLERAWTKELNRLPAADNQTIHIRPEGFLRRLTTQVAPSLLLPFAWALLRCYRRELRIGALFHLGFAASQLLLPFLIGFFLNYLETGLGGTYAGVGIALLLGAVSISSSYCITSTTYWMRRLALNMRGAVMMRIYEHALQLSPPSRRSTPPAQIMNLMSVDADKLFLSAHYLHALWHGPLAIVIVLILLSLEIGVISAVCGMAVLIAMIPVQHYLAHSIKDCRTSMSRDTDGRVRLTNEVIQVIRAVKYYAWEQSMVDRIVIARNIEVAAIFKYLMACGFLREAVYYSVMVCALAVFAVNILVLERSLSVVKVFRIIAYLNAIRYPVNLFGQALKFMTDLFVSVERLDEFFHLPIETADSEAGLSMLRRSAEVGPDSRQPDLEASVGYSHISGDLVDYGEVVLSDASFSWDFSNLLTAEKDCNGGFTGAEGHSAVAEGDMDGVLVPVDISAEVEMISLTTGRTFELYGLTIRTEPGELIAVIGSTGAGKSSFLSGLLGDMPCSNGKCVVKGNFAYCQQEPWIQCMTIRDNILFGADYDDNDINNNSSVANIAYQKAVNCAGLDRDLSILPCGDLTEIGERGINLSGGQRARIALARAILTAHRSDIFLLDDPFAAVDGITGEHMFKKGVLEALNSKLRIVVMNSHMELLQHFDKVLMLDRGRVIAYDSPSSLLESCHKEAFLSMTGLAVAAESVYPGVDPAGTQPPALFTESSSKLSVRLMSVRSMYRAESMDSESASPSLVKKNSHPIASLPGKDECAASDEMQGGALSAAVCIKYFGSCLWTEQKMAIVPIEGLSNTALVAARSWTDMDCADYSLGAIVMLLGFLVFISAQVMRIFSDLFLIEWAEESSANSKNWLLFYRYLVVLGILLLLNLLRMGYLNAVVATCSKNIHRLVLQNVMAASVPMFFDTHAVGEILNRFAKDMEVCDTTIPEFLMQFMINWIQVLSILSICVWTSPLFLVFILPLGYAFVNVYLNFSCVSRDLKRLEGTFRSPVFSSFSETLDGIETIRAFGGRKYFIDAHLLRMDLFQKVSFHLLMSMLWVSARLEMLASLVIFAIAVVGVSLSGSISTVSIGLAMVYTLQLTALLQKCVQISIDLQAYFTSVERTLQYSVLPQEISSWGCGAEADSEGQILLRGGNLQRSRSMSDSEWPSTGSIEFKDVWMRYRDGMQPVLKGLSLKIEGGMRVGICGRTGAGKSTIMVALFRIVEVFQGHVLIDGVDIKGVPLEALRPKIAIIPQEPVMFSGTLRFQLDPFNEFSDVELWGVLEKVFMTSFVKEMQGGLNAVIEESGSNISQGQRQLICIARAALRKCKILVMDEATAAVDPHTDEMIQKVLRGDLIRSGTTVLTIAHRLNTIADYDRVLVLANGKVGEFGNPKKLLRRPTSLFYKMYHCL